MTGGTGRSTCWRFRPACVVAALLLSGALACTASKIVDHPSRLEFPSLVFTPPESEKHRHVLENGTAVYVVEDHSLPLIDVEVFIRAGRYLDPPGQEGLAAAVGHQLRAGGTATYSPEAFDEEVDFLAAEISSVLASTQGSVSFNCLTKDLDRVLELFFDMLEHPRFESSRLDLYKDQLIQTLGRRNDSTSAIEAREWSRLMRGDRHFSVDRVTKSSVERLDREKLTAFHKAHVHPQNFIISVSGDVSAATILAKLESHMKGWAAPAPNDTGGTGGAVSGNTPASIPKPNHEPQRGVYLVNKSDVNQGRVSLGHLAVRRDHPDYFPLQIMNHILGGGGFTSRIMSRVRSDEGLAYTARSQYDFGVYYEGTFKAYFQSKSPSVAKALQIVVEEIEKVRTEKAAEHEVAEAISYFVGIFPRRFATAALVASTFAEDELTGRPSDFWNTFREQIQSVQVGDVLRVAKEHLHPDGLVVLVVGNAEDILMGNAATPEYSLQKIAGTGPIQTIPLPDPLTLEYPNTDS